MKKIDAGPAIVGVLVLAGLLSPFAASAQTGTLRFAQQAPAQPQATTRPPSAEALKAWHGNLLKVPKPKKGCFTASYPSTEWKEVPCTTPPARPYPPRAGGVAPPDVVGGGGSNDVAAQVTGQISSATGSFDTVSAGIAETGTTYGPNCTNPTSGVANTYSLQLNTKPFTTSVCTSPGCQGWQQFVYSNAYGGFIQYWLLNAGASCPAGWASYQNGPQLDCWQNDPNGVSVPPTDVKNLTQLQLTGTASTSGDSVTVWVNGTAHASAPNSDGVLNLAKSWQAAEFNIFGDSCGSQAVFQGNPTINVRLAVDNGTKNPPTCLAQSFTGETNNLNFGPAAPAPTTGTEPAVLLQESSAGGALSACAAATSVGDTHVTTIAGTHYDFQASGDFLAAEAGPDFVVLTRQQSGAPTWPNASVNKAVSARMGKTSVAVCATPMRLVVDGKFNDLADGKSLSLPDGVSVSRHGNVFLIKRKNGDGVRAQVNHIAQPSNDWIDLSVGLGDSSKAANMRGLLANHEGNVNEIVARDGKVLKEPVSFEDLYQHYGNSWRAPPDESLRLCQEAPSSLPTQPFYVHHLTPQQKAAAQKVCIAAGVKEGVALDDCSLDVAVLGNKKTAAHVFVHAINPVVHIKPVLPLPK